MKKGTITSLVFLLGMTLAPVAVFAIDVPWPNTISLQQTIPISFPANYEPSGLAWNRETNKLFTVSDDGKVTRMNLDGSVQETDIPRTNGNGGDFEAITLIDPESPIVYIGIERPNDSIIEYNWETKDVVTKSWNLTNVLTGPENAGLEGLTFVPNRFLPEGMNTSAAGGLFYAAIQRPPVPGGVVTDDFIIYAFDIDITTSGRVVQWWGIPVAPNTPTSDVSDLYFSQDTGLLYVLYDGSNRLVGMTPQGVVVTDYNTVPVVEQEGIVVIPRFPERTASIYIASDSQKLIDLFSGYPIQYYDGDADSVDYLHDCNDADASVFEDQTYYRDADGDGVGNGVATNFCSSSLPDGYVISSQVDCNDNNGTVSAPQVFYQDNDGDGLGSDVTNSFCAIAPPLGYVLNSDDLDDAVAFVEEPIAASLAADGHMEGIELAPWVRYGTPNVLTKTNQDVYGGNQSLYVNAINIGAGFQQINLPLQAGKSYRLSFKYKLLSGEMRTLLGIRSSNVDFENALAKRTPTHEWNTFVRDFTVPENFARDFRFVVSIRNGEGYFDDVIFEEIVTPLLIADGDMERVDASNWKAWATPNALQKTNLTAFAGLQSMYVDSIGKGSGMQQENIVTKPGKTYALSMRYKFTSDGTPGSRLRVLLNLPDIDSHGDFEGLYRNLPQGGENWLLYERIFTIPENTTKNLRLFLTMRYGEAWFDDVSIVEVGQ